MIRAVPAAQQRLGQSASREFAGVDEVAGVPGEGRVHVGHVDLGKLALVHDGPWIRVGALAVGDERHDQAGALVRPQVEAPVLPTHLVAVHVEADTLGQVEPEGAGDLARIVERGPVVVGVHVRDRRHAVVDDLEHLGGRQVDHGGQALDLPRPGVPGAARLGAADMSEPPPLLLLGAEVAGRDRRAVQEAGVGDAPFLKSRDELGVFEHFAHHRAELSEAPVRLDAGERGPGRDLPGVQVDRRFERVFALANESVGGSRYLVALSPGADDILGRFAQRELREGRLAVEPAGVAEDLERAPDFLVAELIERMVSRGRRDGGCREQTESQTEGRLAHGCSP